MDMDYRQIFEELAEMRLVSRFEEWLREQGETIGRRTYYRAIEEQGRTPRQRRVLKLAEKFFTTEVKPAAEVAA